MCNNLVTATIQARMGSTRLPGKVMKMVSGQPLLGWQILRIKKSRLIDDVVVATTDSVIDDEIVHYCKNNNIKFYRGSEHDVLGRVAGAISHFDIEHHVEFCGDSPLIDCDVIDTVIGLYFKNIERYNMAYNAYEISYPPGQDVMIYKGDLLLQINKHLASSDSKRENVGYNLLFCNNVNILKIKALSDYHYPDLYLEVDTEKDFLVVSSIIEHFSSRNKAYFSLREMLDFLSKNKALANLNNSEHRRWKGLKESNVS